MKHQESKRVYWKEMGRSQKSITCHVDAFQVFICFLCEVKRDQIDKSPQLYLKTKKFTQPETINRNFAKVN